MYPLLAKHKYLTPDELILKVCNSNFVPKDTINLEIFTIGSGADAYYIKAESSGSIKINYSTITSLDNISMNISLDSEDQLYSKDFSIHPNVNPNGTLIFPIPAAGNYILQFTSQGNYRANLSIITNGNYFSPLGHHSSSMGVYSDSLSLPRYIYVPDELDTLYLYNYIQGDSTLL